MKTGKGFDWSVWLRQLPKPKVVESSGAVPALNLGALAGLLAPPQQVSPDDKMLLASAIGALLAPRAAGVMLSAPYRWAERENLKAQQAYMQALDRALKLAQIGVESRRAEAPITVAQIESETRRSLAEAQAEADREEREARTRKLQAEAEQIATATEKSRQKLPLEISTSIANLLLRAGDERLSPEERGQLLGYARYLLKEYGVDLSEFLPQDVQPSFVQQRTEAQAQSESARAEESKARTELVQEQAKTERELRPLRVQEKQARIRLIQAQELTERIQPDLIRARIQEIRNNIAMGWRGLALRAQSVQAAIDSRQFEQARRLLGDISKSRAFWERQASELEKSLRVYEEREVVGTGEQQAVRVRTRGVDAATAAELRARAEEARRIANEYRRAEEALMRKLGAVSPSKSRQRIRLPDGTVVEVEGGE
jgi:hypothetical protein